MNLKLTIIGRPNVGKSTLFNRLAKKKLAIVADIPGTTRDLRETKTDYNGLTLRIIDTAGLEEAKKGTLQFRMTSLSVSSISRSEVCLFVIDAREGVTAEDHTYADLARRKAKQIILVANKTESSIAQTGVYEAFSLGLGEPVSISAEHGIGMSKLYERLNKLVEDEIVLSNSQFTNFSSEKISDHKNRTRVIKNNNKIKEAPINISVIGRPNSGKSTLINKIIGDERVLTGPESGITRDSIAFPVNWQGQNFTIHDTAGMRKKAKVTAKLEKLSVAETLRAIRYSELVVLLFDITSAFDSQDLKIADLVEREGRSIIIAINKWDIEKKRYSKKRFLEERLKRLLPQVAGLSLVPISALSGFGLTELNKEILKAYRIWNARVSTARLNNWLLEKTSVHPPPKYKGKSIRLRYITQAKTRPPTFIIFSSTPDTLPESYKRFIINGLRKDFSLLGTPIRLIWRTGSNPFKKK